MATRGPGRRPVMAGALGAVLAAAATTGTVGTVSDAGHHDGSATGVAIAWSGGAAGAGPAPAADPRSRPPSWREGPLPSTRDGHGVGDQLRHPVPRRDRAAAEVLGAVALHGQLPPGMQGAVAGIPAVVLDAYRSAAATQRQQQPGCHVPWWLLAGIGRIESGHAAGGRVDGGGTTRGAILGPRLDGSLPGTAVITDSDGGRFDGDSRFDRAVGPMQFLPSTWAAVAADGNGDGVRDPNNVYDAALGAARYLCAGGADLRTVPGLTDAVLRYNASMSYVRSVLTWGMAYREGVSVSAAQPGPVPTSDPRQPTNTPAPPTRGDQEGRRDHDGPQVVAGSPTSPSSRTGDSPSPSRRTSSGTDDRSGPGRPSGTSGKPAPRPRHTSPPSPGDATRSGTGSTEPAPTSTAPPKTPSPSSSETSGQGSGTTSPGTSAPEPTPTGPSTDAGTTPPPAPATESAPEPGVVSGWVWDDGNGNGQQDPGEPGVAGAVVQLWRNGAPVTVNGVTLGQQTSSDHGNLGTFRFGQVPAGSGYTLHVVVTGAAFTASSGAAPGASSTDSDVGAAGDSAAFSVAASGSVQVDAGVVRSTISGTAFTDTDGDGRRDDGAGPPAQPVAVSVIPVDAAGNPAAGAQGERVFTDESGAYRVPDLGPGRYEIKAVPDSRTAVTNPANGVALVEVGVATQLRVDLALAPPD